MFAIVIIHGQLKRVITYHRIGVPTLWRKTKLSSAPTNWTISANSNAITGGLPISWLRCSEPPLRRPHTVTASMATTRRARVDRTVTALTAGVTSRCPPPWTTITTIGTRMTTRWSRISGTWTLARPTWWTAKRALRFER